MITIDYQADCDGVTARALEELFRAAGLEGRSGDKILRAFKKRSIVRFAKVEGGLIGARNTVLAVEDAKCRNSSTPGPAKLRRNSGRAKASGPRNSGAMAV